MSHIVATKRKKTKAVYCCVVGCHNDTISGRNATPPIAFYSFPGKWYEKRRREAWITAVHRQNPDGSVWQPRKWTLICSRHFVGNAVSNVETDPAFIPTVFPTEYRRKAPDAERHKRWRKRQKKAESQEGSVETEACTSAETQADPAMELDDQTADSEASLDWQDDVAASFQPPLDYGLDVLADVAVEAGALESNRCRDMETQTDGPSAGGQMKILLCVTDGTTGSTQISHNEVQEVLSKPRTCRRRCTFQGFNTLQKSEQALRDLCGVSMAVFTLLLSLLPDQRYRSSDVTREDRLVLMLMKFKLGISLTALAGLFGITKSTAARVFHETMDHLSVKLRTWVFVPPRSTISETMPAIFSRNYPDCTFIIDCTEVRTETPSDPEQQHYLYSHYKGGYTLKWLVGIIPNGMIAFVSEPYGGRHSGSHITRHSGFLTHVMPGDVILSNKGFPSITTTMKDHNAVLVMPPFNTGGGQLSVEDMQTTHAIAQVRIHVERVIGRLKIYNVLSNRVPLSLIPHMGKVMRICAALVNLQSPIIKAP